MTWRRKLKGAIHGAETETAHPSGAPEFYPILFTCLSGVRVVFVVKFHVFTIFVTFVLSDTNSEY